MGKITGFLEYGRVEETYEAREARKKTLPTNHGRSEISKAAAVIG